jgi:hypothetical protein
MPTGCKMLNLGYKPKNKQIFTKETDLFLKSADEAFEVAAAAIQSAQEEPTLPDVKYEVPSEVNSSEWSMTLEAARNTMDYIYYEIYHTCYMLTVVQGKPTLYKLNTDGIPNHYKEEIKTAAAKNPKFKVYEENLDDLRILQCIVKERAEESNMSAPYSRFFKNYKIPLPNGAYILNLTDAVLLRKDFKTPWGGNSKYTHGRFLPVLGGSGAVGFFDIPIVNYDDLSIAQNPTKLATYETDWSKKKAKAVFRGSPSGCGTNAETNMRIKIAEMKTDPAILDAGITRIAEGTPRFDPVRGLSILDTTAKKIGFMNLVEQSKHKYIVHIDGNVAAYRLLHTMMTGSLILKVKGKYTMWTDHMVKDGVHYIGINEDLSDLEEKIRWCMEHDTECETIAQNAYEFAKMALSKEYVDVAFAQTMWATYKSSISASSPLIKPGANEGGRRRKTHKRMMKLSKSKKQTKRVRRR